MSDRYAAYTRLKIDYPSKRILRLTFDRPETYNSVDAETHTQLTHIWRDINGEYTAWESGLDRFIALDKGPFVGREALIRQRDPGSGRRLVTLHIDPPKEAEAMGAEAMGNESLFADGVLVGRVTSANHARTLGFNIALGYVATAHAAPGSELRLKILDREATARVIPDSPYDPASARSRSLPPGFRPQGSRTCSCATRGSGDG